MSQETADAVTPPYAQPGVRDEHDEKKENIPTAPAAKAENDRWEFHAAKFRDFTALDNTMNQTSATDFFNNTNGLGSPEFYAERRRKELAEQEAKNKRRRSYQAPTAGSRLRSSSSNTNVHPATAPRGITPTRMLKPPAPAVAVPLPVSKKPAAVKPAVVKQADAKPPAPVVPQKPVTRSMTQEARRRSSYMDATEATRRRSSAAVPAVRPVAKPAAPKPAAVKPVVEKPPARPAVPPATRAAKPPAVRMDEGPVSALFGRKFGDPKYADVRVVAGGRAFHAVKGDSPDALGGLQRAAHARRDDPPDRGLRAADRRVDAPLHAHGPRGARGAGRPAALPRRRPLRRPVAAGPDRRVHVRPDGARERGRNAGVLAPARGPRETARVGAGVRRPPLPAAARSGRVGGVRRQTPGRRPADRGESGHRRVSSVVWAFVTSCFCCLV
ncbi:hypothetical protein M3Y99_01361700 [Aphelenchoides fujianensis]|nr:hypothetical protein M3Y99_01361700 [Aphelenchoides fujianensis]